MLIWIQALAQAVADRVMAMIPRRRPQRDALRRLRLVSHRGEHDNREILENTLPAFDRARQAGVWGIEADLRWTADLVPVIIHDPDTARVFGGRMRVNEVTFAELRARHPALPSLAEVLEEFGGNTHLMLELKDEPFPDLQRQRESLWAHLSSLEPGVDYHLLALDMRLFELFDNFPRHCCLPVAELNTRTLSEQALAAGYGGLTGHYLLLSAEIQRRHENLGQRIGTGFVRSRYCLYREINRQVAWVFSNDAVALQGLVSHMLDDGGDVVEP